MQGQIRVKNFNYKEKLIFFENAFAFLQLLNYKTW